MSKIKIFFSHSSEDEAIINIIDTKIRENNFIDTWFDKRADTGIKDGDRIDYRIIDGIQNEVDYFLIFISKNIFESKWVLKEIELAVRKNNKIFKYNFIIPAYIGQKKELDDLIIEKSKNGNKLCGYLKKIIDNQKNIRTDSRIIDEDLSKVQKDIVQIAKDFESAIHNKISNDFKKNVKEHKEPLYFNINTANQFYESSRKFRRGIFFNVQIDIQEWFRPEFQVHLALQKSIEDNVNFQNINKCQIDTIPENINKCKSSIPKMVHSRILFVTYSSDELHTMFKSNENKIVNFRSFINIHNLMGSPLAIIPIDYFIEIISTNNFFRNEDVLKLLGLPLTFKNYEIDRYDKNNLNKLKEALEKQSNISGVVNPNIDFAIFDDNFNFEKPNIWCGSVSKQNEIFYYQIPDDSYPNLNGFSRDNIKSIDKQHKRHEYIKEFTKIIVEEVFHYPEKEVKISNNENYENRLKLNPKYSIFYDKLTNKDTCDFYIDYHYSPWFFKYHKENLHDNVEFLYFT